MASAVQLPNSVDAQLVTLGKTFESVKKHFRAFEAHEAKSTQMLYLALHELYVFGETLLNLPSPPGSSMVREFITGAGGTFGAPVAKNPYLGLVKLAFPRREISSVSQYAAVLRYANSTRVQPSAFHGWLTSQGIKQLYDEALDHLNSNQRKSNNQGKLSRVARATTALMARAHSPAVTLPQGVQAPEGFALVLARIDSSNNAAIIDVLESDQNSLEATILRYDDKGQRAPVSSEALAPLHRAVALVVGSTRPKAAGSRDILVINTDLDGEPVCRVEAVSKSYSFTGAAVLVRGHQGDLPADQPLILHSADADTFLAEFQSHQNWTLDEAGQLTGEGLAQPLTLTILADQHGYRVAILGPKGDRALHVTIEEQLNMTAFLARQRETVARQNEGRAEQRSIGTQVRLSISHDKLRVAIPKLLGEQEFGSTIAEGPLDAVLLVADLENLVTALEPHEVDLHGWFVDREVDDAALAFETYLDDDLFTVILPTRADRAYNQVCEELTL